MALPIPVPEPLWPASLSSLKAVDNLLRCGICFDYLSIAMIIPQCSHNYCSLCIRKFLSYKPQCPTCCVAVSESDLKNNRVLDELVKSFNSASRRSAGKSHVKSSVSWTAVKEDMPVIGSFLTKEKVCTSTKADSLAGTDEKSLKTEEHHDLYSSSAEIDNKDNKVGSQESPKCTKSQEKPSTSLVKAVSKVACPVCEVAIPEEYINKHLDTCLTREEKKDCLRSSAHKRKPLPKVVYSLLSDRDLKKKLKQHGLSTRGTRQQLIKRHQEFVHMYNAQCDSLNPKSAAEIVKELENNEKIRLLLELNKPGESSLTSTKDKTEEEIDKIHSDYRKKHRSQFKFLVDQVENRWKQSGKIKTESAKNKEVATAKDLPAATEHREEHHTGFALGKDQVPKPDTPDERSDSPTFPLSPESTSSSSSDILRDLEGFETRSASSDERASSGPGVNKRESHWPHALGNVQLLPKRKRKKN
ncbi:E3 ubiquitin-protein ligase RAD18 [Neopsephotus bourkii]|uniref:E3 ubiquitin-protein ligase RAD18 n=1 Tax=Neopsephotus bourkii TaxID=309878 RepID=UPI002AA54AB8|nr:E3 ubiquitin-protein ligase RAD18 [Neopsephotus bourkii]